ncbi:MAG: hypothetical protein HON23_00975 [Rickettsiales bacterium]|jgi:hypothetical protein|nr:hypothetical protein [Rickettsiales bacterium]
MNKAIILSALALMLIYFALFPRAASGYGYMGYYGYHRGPSFFYFGGASTYYGRSIRGGSVSGSRVRGGGPGSGK